ncbi:hypothetical protein AAFP30_17080 [Gordonia sp. CPCC 205515]|uniref:hypothetical protein n=1 Tax=Gordonia sp. CPCC 205515 TaxID=3140791 RepID=UPI003AF3F5B4
MSETRSPRTRRRRAIAAAAIALIAVLVAVVAAFGIRRAQPVPDDAERSAVLAATRDAITALMTFAPTDDAATRTAVTAQLTGPLLVRYRSEGPDVVLPTAVETGASMTVQVQGVGVDTYDTDRAEVLVFADQMIRVPGVSTSGDGERTPIARWALMRNVEGNWRLAALGAVGDVTR